MKKKFYSLLLLLTAMLLLPTLNVQGQNFQWARTLSPTYLPNYMLGSDPSGNAYTIVNDGLTKYSPQGNQLWVSPLSVSEVDDMVVTHRGVYLLMYTSSSGSYNYLSLPSQRIIIIHTNPDGKIVWMKILPHEQIRSIAADPSGRVYVTGYIRRGFEVDGIMLTPEKPAAGTQIRHTNILMQFNENGVLQWGRLWNRVANPVGTIHVGGDLKTDLQGNVYISLTFNETMLIEGRSFTLPTNNPYYQTLYMKYNSMGQLQWVDVLPIRGGWDVDYLGNTYFLAIPEGNTLTFNGSTLPDPIARTAFFKIDSDGLLQWRRPVYPLSLSNRVMFCDEIGNIYISGVEDQTPLHDKCTIVKFNSETEPLWVKSFTGINSNYYRLLSKSRDFYIREVYRQGLI